MILRCFSRGEMIAMRIRFVFSALCCLRMVSDTFAADAPEFQSGVMPIFRKYCVGCHNVQEANGGLLLVDYVRTMQGGESGPAVNAGQSDESRLWRLVSGQDGPRMPPEESAQPTLPELAIIKAWIDGGAKSPSGELSITGLVTPKIEPQGIVREPVTSLVASPDGKWIAVGRPQSVEILHAVDHSVARSLTGHTGSINDINFSSTGEWLCVASGETGLLGEATLWRVSDWQRGPAIRGHRDAIYAAQLNHDATILVTGSYDREAMAWDVSTGLPQQTFQGHNDAIYGLSLSPNGQLLATASGDRTIKLWDVRSGQRLDTLTQPTKDQTSVAFSPDGQYLAAGGVDCRLRIWQISPSAAEGTNPILHARFAHEEPILKIAFSADGRLLASSSSDRRIKVWETQTFTQIAVLERQEDWAAAVAFSSDGTQLLAGRMNGSVTRYALNPKGSDATGQRQLLTDSSGASSAAAVSKSVLQVEVEPNDGPETSTAFALPGEIRGQFQRVSNNRDTAQKHQEAMSDRDIYRINVRSGEVWVVETNAARSGSRADTKVEVLHADGRPVLRANLQAVRDSWINFRPTNSIATNVRLEFWQEMDLNQFLYMNGEICKTFRAPSGPDSAFQFYAIAGKRRGYFDTSAMSHAKEEPCYIVEAYPAGSPIVENGLPTFPLYFANDDDAERKLGRDSRLTLTSPVDETYLIQVTDVRGFTGDDFHYTLMVRRPKPDFRVTVDTMNPQVSPGSGQRLKFTLDRQDHFDEEVRIDIVGLPAGFAAASPVVIAAGHVEATSVIRAALLAPEPKQEDWLQVAVLASGVINGELVTKAVGHLGEIKLAQPATVRIRLVPDDPKSTSADGGLVIQSGSMITAKVVVERNGFDGDIRVDVNNLPQGVIVENLGLSGLLIRAKETERQIFLASRPWVSASSQWITAVAQVEGNQSSPEIILHVKKTSDVANK